MFGNKKGLEQKLSEHGGTVAWATVSDATTQFTSGSNYQSGPFTVGNHEHMKVTLEVQPEGQPPFEATFHQTFAGKMPIAGFQAKVIYDPDDHSKIAILEDQIFPPGISHEQAERFGAHEQQAKAAAESGHMAEFVAQDIAARKAEAAARVAQAQAGMGANVAQFIEQMNAGGAGSRVIVDGVPLSPAGAPAPDAADELTKLAHLHDRGVLTDEEFAAQKAKVLARP